MAETLLNGRYRVERKLGEGGMGEVFEVSDSVYGDRRVAYKLLKAQGGNLEYFKHEFKLLARLDHPNLVKVYDFGITEGGCYYTCELLDGQDLYKATEGIDWEGLYEISRQVLEALAYIHDRGLVHYDVKPENLNVRIVPPARAGLKPTYVVKLVDFGLTGEATTRGGGKIKGTVHYMAPEVAKEQPADQRADLYSFGITLYYAVTRKLPYDGGSAFSVIRKHLERIPEPPTSIREDIPEGWQRFILKLLEKDPADRFPSADAALSDLSRRMGRSGASERITRAQMTARRETVVLSSRFVGRSRELELLGKALPDPATRPRDAPLLVLVTGEGGIGKSRLLDELKVVSQLRGVPFLKTECREVAGAAPLERIVRHVLLLEGDGKARPREKRPTDPAAPGDWTDRGSSGERAALPPAPIAEIVKAYRDELEALFPGITGERTTEETPREHDRRLVHDRVAHFLVRAARARPFALAVEDVHWADDATAGLLEALARNILFDARGTTRSVAPILLILTLRADEAKERPALAGLLGLAPLVPSPEKTGSGGAVHILRSQRLELSRLDERETTAVVASMLALPAPDPALGKKLHDASNGNPFFAEELVRALLEEGVLVPRRGLARPEDLARVEPPKSLAELLGRRLAGLGDEARRVLQALAVLGRPSPLAVLSPTAGIPTESALDALDALAEKQLALRSNPDPDASQEEGPRFATAHAQITRAVLKGISPSDERALHGRAALALEKFATKIGERDSVLEQLARHFALAGEARKALDYSLAAGERAALAHRNEEAIDHFGRAIDLIKSPALARKDAGGQDAVPAGLEARVLEKLGEALSTIGRYGDAARVLESLVAEGGPPLDEAAGARVRRRLGAVALKRGDYGTATHWLKEALERISDRSSLKRERAKVLQNMARIGLWRGDYLAAIALATEAIELWKALKATRERLAAINVLSSAEYYRGRYTRAAQLLRESLELSRQGQTTWRALLRDLGVEDEADQGVEEALAFLKRGGALRRGAGDAYGIVLSFSELGTYCDLRGDTEQNLHFHELSLAVYERMGNTQGTALSLNNLGVYRRLQGEHAVALGLFERSLAIHEGTNDRHGGAVTLQNLALLRLAIGDLEGAEAQARRALTFAREIGVAWLTGHSHRALGRAAFLRGDRDAAEGELTRAEGVFRRLGNPRSLGDVLLDRAEVALERGDHEAALERVERARKTGDEEKGEDFLARQRLIAGTVLLAKDPGKAILDFEAALGYADAIKLGELRLDAHRALVAAHARHGTLRLAVRHAERARELEDALSGGLPPELRERFFRFGPTVRAREEAKRLQERLLAEEESGA
jgi:tetratricopeptide (TPR) repeat protein